MKKLLWDLFVHTGRIEYYVKYKEVNSNENNKRRN